MHLKIFGNKPGTDDPNKTLKTQELLQNFPPAIILWLKRQLLKLGNPFLGR
jgi:hypothetical protein